MSVEGPISFDDWFSKLKSILIGQDELLEELILKFIKMRINSTGFHGFCLDGISGAGKTVLARRLVETAPFEAHYVDAVELFISSRIGGPENKLKQLFERPKSKNSPKLIVLDNAEAILSIHNLKRATDSELSGFSSDSMAIERRMYLLTKSLFDKSNESTDSLIFFAAIISDRSILPAEIRYPGRLNHSFNVNSSKSEQRAAILRTLLSGFSFKSSDGYKENCINILSSHLTSGFTPADLEGYVQRAFEVRVANDFLTFEDFLRARNLINPSSIVARVTKFSPPDIKLIGLDEEMGIIQQYLSSIFRNERRDPLPRGILLEGPSGCGKSLVASRLSSIDFYMDGQSVKFPINFISIDSTQVVSKYLGQSDRNLSKIFAEARQAAPCILFFDQIDTLVGRRQLSSDGGAEDRLVTTFLVEMDGLKSKMDSGRAVIVVGTTNRKSRIDPAILRPGRLDLHVNIPLPSTQKRAEFMNHLIERANGKYQLTSHEMTTLIEATEKASYAEIESIFKEAALTALREDLNCSAVLFRHFK